MPSPRRPRGWHDGRAFGAVVTLAARVCDDRAERIVFMCVETLIRAMLVEQSAVAHQLAGERGAHAKVPDLERAVSS